jgi:hypothetical protein
MSEYEVTISESVAPGARDRSSSLMVRTVDWHGEAESEEAARQAAWTAWEQQYGSQRERPAQAEVRVIKVTA